MDLYSIYNRLMSAYAKSSRLLVSGYALPFINLVLELTYRCNLNCAMCYQRSQERDFGINPPRKKDELSFEQIKHLIDQTLPFCIIIFSGGEPFCRRDIMDILAYTARKRRCHIVTNAALIKPQDARRLVDLGLLSIGISIDGDPTIHDSIRGIPGTFDRMARTVQEIKKYRDSLGKSRPVLNFKTVILAENVHKLTDIYEISKEMGADYCTFQLENSSLEISALRLSHDFSPFKSAPAPIPGMDHELLEKALFDLTSSKEKKPVVRFIPDFSMADIQAHYDNAIDITNFSCQNPWVGMNVSPYGEVFPCFNFAIGNVQQHSLFSLWNNPQFRLFRQTLKRDGLFRGCIGCCDLERKATTSTRL